MDDSTKPENVARVPGKRGRPKGSPNRITQDLRESILQAYHKAGARDYLVGVARKRPDVFCALLGKIIPQETRLSVMASYQAMPIPVEQRDSLPQIAQEARGDVLDAVYAVMSDPLPAALPASDDWLDA